MDNAGGVYSPTGKVNTGVNIGLAAKNNAPSAAAATGTGTGT